MSSSVVHAAFHISSRVKKKQAFLDTLSIPLMLLLFLHFPFIYRSDAQPESA